MGSPLFGELNVELFKKNTKRKMRMVLLAAALGGWTHLVLGALGCGAYANPPDKVARYWREVLEEPIFQGRFKLVVFAILGPVSAPFLQEFGSAAIE